MKLTFAKKMFTALLAVALSLPTWAQELPTDAAPTIVAPQEQTISSRERTLSYEIIANVDYEITCDASWVTLKKADGRLYVHSQQNYANEPRTATITITNAELNITRQFVLTQNGDDSASEAPAIDHPEYAIFADDVLSSLKEGVTLDDIEKVQNPFIKALAMQMYSGKYETNYRIGSYECYLSYVTLSNLWNAPGKYYDQIAGVTGISIPAKSKNAVVVSGIPNGIEVKLKVVAWYVGKVGGNFDGGDPNTTEFTLKNGVNIINYNYNWDGLAYVCYYAQQNEDQYPDIKVHFVNGHINGYLSNEKTNQEMYELCKNAKNYCMDVVGDKVHSIWTSEGLSKYCKADDGTSLGYRQYINTIDSLIEWEHDLLGFNKYNRTPKNRTMAYVNFTYYMFQGGFGVSFHQDQESRVLNCRTLIHRDDDAIWGLSHEWGHQHQMQPYFCWAGQSEISNNMNSYYNIMHMGYRTSDKINQWDPARKHFLEDYEFKSGKKVSEPRQLAYQNRNLLSFSSKMVAMCESMKDGIISAYAEDPTKAVAQTEVGVGEGLCPFIMLYAYFSTHGCPDIAKDWYEALRQNDEPNGSQVEKKGGVDKYELIASAQNNNKNNKFAELKKLYPNTCWVTDKYITENNNNMWNNSVPYIFNYIRKVSRITGYNLVPYFERWGFLRQIANYIGDYGNKWYVMTPEMYNEFIEDMDALVKSGELKTMPEGMVEEISRTPNLFQNTPVIPN